MDEIDEVRKKILSLGKQMLDLYHTLPQNGCLRKIIIGVDDNEYGDNLMMFQGSKEDGYAVQNFLNNRPKK